MSLIGMWLFIFGGLMAHSEFTAALDTETWDLVLGEDGNLKMLRGDIAIRQNVSNECRCFLNDLYFDKERGIDWFSNQVALPVQAVTTISQLRRAAASVVGVSSVDEVKLETLNRETRDLHGVIKVTTASNSDGTVNF